MADHGAKLDDGRTIDGDLYRRIRDEELATMGDRPHVQTAARLFDELILANELADFLTLPAYEEILKNEDEYLATCCGEPMMMVDHHYYENLTPPRIDEILDKLD